MELLVLGLVATIGFASYALWSRAHQTEHTPLLDAPERTVGTLQVGDVVQHLGTDWLVEGVMTFSADGRGARLYRLADGAVVRFLYAEPGDSEPSLLESRPQIAVDGLPEILLCDGCTFHLRSRATAGVVRAGAFDRRAGERVGVAQYCAGMARMLVLHWSDRIDTFVGERVGTNLLELLPGK
jgi:hypothetical protein